MKLERIAVAAIILYLAIALPLAVLNNRAMEACATECSREGFDIVLSATGQGNTTECRCLNQHDRAEKVILID